MGVAAAEFSSAGQTTRHLIPGVYSRRNTVGGGSGVPSGNLVIIGSSMGGEPLKLGVVSDKSEAINALINGDLLNGVVHAFTGSKTYIPQQVFYLRVNKGTQAQLELKNGSNTILNLKSSDYGSHTNQIKLWLQEGTTGRKVLSSYKEESIVIDNIIKESFGLLYVGDGSSGKCTIEKNGLTLSSVDSSDAVIPGEAISIAWDECETMSALVDRINDTGYYVATLFGDNDASVRELDHVTVVSVGNSLVKFNSNLRALIDALETIPYIGEVKISEGANNLLPDNNTGYKYFTGGTTEIPTIADWNEALDVLEKEDIQIIATPSIDGDVHTLISNHCVSMCTVSKKKERTFWIGLADNMNMEDALRAASNLKTEFGSVVMTGANASNPVSGASTEISPALLACKCAGMEAAIDISNPLTNKEMNVNSFTKKYKTSELEAMISGGIVPFGENDEGSLVCIRAVTCYQGENLILNERSMIRAAINMDRDLRKAYSKRTGTNNEPNESDILQVLKNKAKEWYIKKLITKNDSGELVFNAKVRFDGDKTCLTYDRYVRAPNNFVFITGTNKGYRSTIEV